MNKSDDIVTFICDTFERDNADVSEAAHETMLAASKVLVNIIQGLLAHDSGPFNGIELSRELVQSVRTGWSRTLDMIEVEINDAEASK